MPLYSEFPSAPRNDPNANNPAVLGLLKPGVSLDQANAEITGIAQRFADGVSRHQQAVQHRPGRAAHQDLHAGTHPRHAVDDAGVLRGRAADRVRQRDEHAVRARHAARQGTGDPLVARRDADPADPPDADREPAGRRASAPALGVGLAYFAINWLRRDGPQSRQPAAVLDHVRHRRPGARRHGGRHAGRRARLGPAAGVDVVARQRDRNMLQGRRPRQRPSRGVNFVSRGLVVVADRRHLRPADRLAAAGAVDRQPADDRLRLRHRRHHVGAHGPDGRRLSDARSRASSSTTGCSLELRNDPRVRGRRAHQPLPHGLLRQRPDRDRRARRTRTTATGRTPTSSR